MNNLILSYSYMYIDFLKKIPYLLPVGSMADSTKVDIWPDDEHINNCLISIIHYLSIMCDTKDKSITLVVTLIKRKKNTLILASFTHI